MFKGLIKYLLSLSILVLSGFSPWASQPLDEILSELSSDSVCIATHMDVGDLNKSSSSSRKENPLPLAVEIEEEEDEKISSKKRIKQIESSHFFTNCFFSSLPDFCFHSLKKSLQVRQHSLHFLSVNTLSSTYIILQVFRI